MSPIAHSSGAGVAEKKTSSVNIKQSWLPKKYKQVTEIKV